MKKRYYRITLISGKVYELHFHKFYKDKFGQPEFIPDLEPTTPKFLQHACELAAGGFFEPGSEARPKWIAPSQVRHVEVVIEEEEKKDDSKIITLAQ
jgi:hypothetical protein